MLLLYTLKQALRMQAIYKIYMRPLCWIRPERIYKPLLACHTYCHYVCYLYDNHVIIDDWVIRFSSFSLSLSLYHNMAHGINLTPRQFLCAPRMAPLITIPPPPPFCFAYNRLSRSQKYTLICASLNPN